MFLIDYEKDWAGERLVTDDPVIVVRDIIAKVPSSQSLMIRIERVPVKLSKQAAG